MQDPQLVDWLMSASTPSIRRFTLRRLLNRPQTDAEVQAATREMEAAGPIPTILAGQTETGQWSGERGFYGPKFTSTHWSMVLLTELGADGGDPRFQRGVSYVLTATEKEPALAATGREHRWQCLWGNLLRYALHGGQGNDPRVERIVRYLVREGETGWTCAPHNRGLPCAWGAARALWGLAALPAQQRSPEVESCIQGALDFLLEGDRLVKGDYPTSGRVHALWSKLNFPLFYQADALFVLRAVAEAGALDHPGAQSALDWLSARRGANGHWRGASPFSGRTWPFFSDREETSRWVSLQAAMVLR